MNGRRAFERQWDEIANFIATTTHKKTACHVCGGDGYVEEIEEYIAAWPRYEKYACPWCKGAKTLHVRAKCRPCQRGEGVTA